MKNNKLKMNKIANKVTSDRRRALLGMGGVVAVWHKPLVSAIVLPAHAQMSVATCPMIAIANVVTGPESSLNPPLCNVVFDILSGDSAVTLTILSVTTTTLDDADSSVDVALLGEATSITGPRVTWRGPATTAPSCDAFDPITDVTFIIEASCDVVDEPFTQEFLLSDILA